MRIIPEIYIDALFRDKLHELTGLQHFVIFTVISQFLHIIKGFILFVRAPGSLKFVHRITCPSAREITAYQSVGVGKVLHQDLIAVIELRDAPGGKQPGDTRFIFVKIFTHYRIKTAEVVVI
ncbi:hypothetical protein D9M68_534800 [compost metagenome]